VGIHVFNHNISVSFKSDARAHSREDVCKGIKEQVLEKVILAIHSSKNLLAESAIEAYSFHFTYVGDECSDNVVCSPSYPCRKAVAEFDVHER